MSNENNELKPCPFCGLKPDLEDGDTLHPSATGWKPQQNGIRTYHSFREVPKEQWCWEINCPTTAGGCGINMTDDSKEEVIAKWNKRVSIS